ncbi:MAG TPA: hypothetical protein VLI04_18585 [Nocardioidaceae bacterium]|nr:hypothetical protein [Nocardioidaceae bacterium]
MELTRTFSEQQFAAALESWQWIGLEGLDPWFSTAFGDVFLIGDDGVYWLDICSGELTRPFSSAEDAQRVLATDDGLDEYLLAGLVFAAAETGLTATGSDILDFKVPPVLGGDFDVPNLQVTDFEVAVHLAGQLHEQIKDLPDGAEISGFSFD